MPLLCDFGSLVAEVNLRAPVTDGSVMVSLVESQGRRFEAKRLIAEGTSSGGTAVAKKTQERILKVSKQGSTRPWEVNFKVPMGVFQNGLRICRVVDRDQRVSVALSAGSTEKQASNRMMTPSVGDIYRVYYNAQVRIYL